MEKKNSQFDFFYAVNNTRILRSPSGTLETFGSTNLRYALVSELMDVPGKVRVREGRLTAMRPLIIVPGENSIDMEGFGEQARAYMDWLKENGGGDVRVLQYGYSLKREAFSEQILSDGIPNVLGRVLEEAAKRNDPYEAVLKGVDEPWDVCLVKLFWEVTAKSVPSNVREFEIERRKELADGIPRDVRVEIEAAFDAARRDRSKLNDLARLLQKHDLFDHYQDRFFALVR